MSGIFNRYYLQPIPVTVIEIGIVLFNMFLNGRLWELHTFFKGIILPGSQVPSGTMLLILKEILSSFTRGSVIRLIQTSSGIVAKTQVLPFSLIRGVHFGNSNFWRNAAWLQSKHSVMCLLLSL